MLLDAGAEPRADDDATALMLAAINTNPVAVQALVDAGAEVTDLVIEALQENQALHGTDVYRAIERSRAE